LFNDFDPRHNPRKSSDRSPIRSVGLFVVFVVGFLGGGALLLAGLLFGGILLFGEVYFPAETGPFSLNDFLALASSNRWASSTRLLTPVHEWLDKIPAVPVLIVVGPALIGTALFAAKNRH